MIEETVPHIEDLAILELHNTDSTTTSSIAWRMCPTSQMILLDKFLDYGTCFNVFKYFSC